MILLTDHFVIMKTTTRNDRGPCRHANNEYDYTKLQ